MKLSYDEYNSPIGKIGVVVSMKGVCRIEILEDKWEKYLKINPQVVKNQDACKEVIKQLDEYFKGVRKEFTLPLDINGTTFREKVWLALCQIPYGATKSYKKIAETIDNPKAVRAIGQANRNNPIPIIVPCHRVVGNNGKLVGYSGNHTDIQMWLLKHEGCELSAEFENDK